MDKLPIIDIHSHILPHMDDGSKSVDMTNSMLDIMYQEGVNYVCATPHFRGWHESVDDFVERRNKAYNHLLERKIENSPKIILGSEIAYFSGITNIDIKKLCYDNTNTILLEMPMGKWEDQEFSNIETLVLDKGLKVILAHFERYYDKNNDDKVFNMIENLSIGVQINAFTINSFFMRKRYVSLFKNNIANLLGSDCHNLDNRKPGLEKCRKILKNQIEIESIDRLGKCLLNLR